MKLETKKDVLDVLAMTDEAYRSQVLPLAAARLQEVRHNELIASAMLGVSNICRNRCLYCGMRSDNKEIQRYRLEQEQVVEAGRQAIKLGFRRMFLISGEDEGYGFDKMLLAVEALAAMGLRVSLALGELEEGQYGELKGAGATEYVLKFEMGQREIYNRMKPQSDFHARLKGMEWIRKAGLLLASGSIVDYPGQTDQQLAEDVLLTRDLEVSWAPIIPYMPAKGTPLAREGGPGSLEKNLRVISLLRLMLPEADITAQQPGTDPARGLADPEGNLNALAAGGNILFADLLPQALAGSFSVVDNRVTSSLAHMEDMAARSGMSLTFSASGSKMT